MPPNLVNFCLETAESGWRVFAHSPKFSHWETLPALPHVRYITGSRQTLARVMKWHELTVYNNRMPGGLTPGFAMHLDGVVQLQDSWSVAVIYFHRQ